MRFGPELGSVTARVGQPWKAIKARASLETQALKVQVAKDKTILESAVSREATGPLGFMQKRYPTKLGSILVGATTYFLDRVISGDSPKKILEREEIAAQNEAIIKVFTNLSKP
ncbi:MAG: hypothetical protein NUV73_03595 [Candidatus Daviesbacteria bacterium]|nr:hypothetical protein [Candidatus Daviesbacteria bacterium]